jgi:hypothetical protein
MMSVEQRMNDALSDLEAMLNEGRLPEEAITACAADYGFKSTVLKLRAQNVFGDLGSVRERSLKQAQVLMREHKAEKAIDRYLTENPDANFPEWFEAEVGRPPTKAERDEFSERYMQFLVRNLHFEI